MTAMDSNPFATGGQPSDHFPTPAAHPAAMYEEEDYDPYEASGAAGNAKHARGGYNQLEGGAAKGVYKPALNEREEALLRREKELQAREEQLREMEQNATRHSGTPEPNWPFKFYKIAYHDIRAEIPVEHRHLMRQFYVTVIFTWLALTLNWFINLMTWFSPYAGSDAASSAMWGTIYLGFGVPGAWKLWYRNLYFGTRDSSSRMWVMFFIYFSIHMFFIALVGLGVPGMAGAGFFVMLKLFANGQSFVGILALANTVIYGLLFLMSMYLIKQSHNVWKGAGGSERLKQSVASALVNEGLVGAAANAAATSMAGDSRV